MANLHLRKRHPRWRKQQSQQLQTQPEPQPGMPFTDENGNGYPDGFEEQEKTLLEKIAQRRSQFMQKSGEVESNFINRNESTYASGISADQSAELNDLSNLFKD